MNIPNTFEIVIGILGITVISLNFINGYLLNQKVIPIVGAILLSGAFVLYEPTRSAYLVYLAFVLDAGTLFLFKGIFRDIMLPGIKKTLLEARDIISIIKKKKMKFTFQKIRSVIFILFQLFLGIAIFVGSFFYAKFIYLKIKENGSDLIITIMNIPFIVFILASICGIFRFFIEIAYKIISSITE